MYLPIKKRKLQISNMTSNIQDIEANRVRTQHDGFLPSQAVKNDIKNFLVWVISIVFIIGIVVLHGIGIRLLYDECHELIKLNIPIAFICYILDFVSSVLLLLTYNNCI